MSSPEPPRRSRPWLVKLFSLKEIGVILAALILTGLLVKTGTGISPPAAEADAPPSQPPSPVPTTSAPVTPFATDDKGFVDSLARCGDTQTAVAMAGTQSALVAICADGSGGYEYRGVRLRDGASLKAAATPRSRGGFVVENDGVQYTISPDELVVTAGDKEIHREPVTVYLQPNSGSYPAEEPPATQAPR